MLPPSIVSSIVSLVECSVCVAQLYADTPLPLFRVGVCPRPGERLSQSRLTMIDVPHHPDVHFGLIDEGRCQLITPVVTPLRQRADRQGVRRQ